jgi:alpha-tubulin suppressor-like RCC1 family protein
MAFVFIAMTACSDEPTAAPRAIRPGVPAHDISVAGGSPYLLSAEVSGPDLRQPLVYDIPLEGGTSGSALAMPAGDVRDVTLRAHDQYGEVTHEGRFTLERLGVGPNEPVSVLLEPIGDGKELEAKLDVVGEEPMREGQLVIESRADAVYEGQQMTVDAYVLDAYGNRMEIDPSELHWAVSDPRGGRMVARARQADFLAVSPRYDTGIIVTFKDLYQILYPKVIADPYIDISAGMEHACGLKQSGAIFCWGFNNDGQLGSPLNNQCASTMFCQTRPTIVSGGKQWRALGVGDRHSCAIDINRQAFCWGQGDDGRLGNPNATSNGVPNPTPLQVSSGRLFDAISGGDAHTCALEYATSAAYCWGSQLNGELGNGLSSALPAGPTPVAGNHMWRQINAAFGFTCGRDANLATWCWGGNKNWSLGHAGLWQTWNTGWRDTVPRLTDNTLHALSISRGVGLGACLLAISGSTFCWGTNDLGQTGIGSTSLAVQSPTQAQTMETFSAISEGGMHTCALNTAGEAFCWGRNTWGELGDNTFTDRTIPTRVATSFLFTHIAVGQTHTCAIRNSGEAYCWGQGWYGLLGNGTMNVNSSVPVKVAP